MKVTVEQLLNMNYVKYNKMIELINSAFAGSNAETLNIYVDIYSMLKPIYSIDCLIEDYAVITSCIINLCAHYREFFRTRYKVETRFFLVYSENCGYINKQFYPEYNKKTEYNINSNKLMHDMVKNNIELLQTLCPYLPDIHFINGTFETGVIIYDLICKNELIDNSPHMIITKDMYNYQLIPTRDNIIILRPKKNTGFDESYYINKYLALNTYITERKCKYISIDTILMPGLLSLIMTLSSVSERSIKSLFNINTSLKMIEKAINEFKILNGYNSDLQNVFNSIYNDKFKIGFETFQFRYKAIDIIFQHSVYMNTPECKSIIINNLNDPETVKDINNRYFKKCPLDLNRL